MNMLHVVVAVLSTSEPLRPPPPHSVGYASAATTARVCNDLALLRHGISFFKFKPRGSIAVQSRGSHLLNLASLAGDHDDLAREDYVLGVA